MAIQTIFVGTTPGDDTGDPARTCFIKINENFTQPENAASRLVATPAEALAGTAGVLPDAAGVKAHVDSRITASVTDTTAGRLLKVGDFGLGSSTDASAVSIIPDTNNSNGFFRSADSAAGNPVSAPHEIIQVVFDANSSKQLAFRAGSPTLRIHARAKSGGVWQSWREFWHTGNTTVDPNGFIKQASPIVSLYKDRAESNGSAELEEMRFERISAGHYRLTGVPELSRDGWYIETPKDRNGNIYFTLDYVESENTLEILTYEPDYSSGRAENGEPVDIIDGRFVSLRFAASPETELPEEA